MLSRRSLFAGLATLPVLAWLPKFAFATEEPFGKHEPYDYDSLRLWTTKTGMAIIAYDPEDAVRIFLLNLPCSPKTCMCQKFCRAKKLAFWKDLWRRGVESTWGKAWVVGSNPEEWTCVPRNVHFPLERKHPGHSAYEGRVLFHHANGERDTDHWERITNHDGFFTQTVYATTRSWARGLMPGMERGQRFLTEFNQWCVPEGALFP